MDVGNAIRTLRIERGLTQKELGIRCKMKDAAIRHYESGRGNPTLETLQAIAAALGVQVVDLLGPYEGPPLPGLVDGDKVEETEPFHDSPPLLPSEFNEFERFIETLGYYTKLDGDNYRLHKGKASVIITPEQLKALVRASKATVTALVQDLMETATPPQEGSEGPQEGE